MRFKNWIPAFAGMTAMLGLSACEGIGDGSTLQTLEVRPANGSTVTPGSPYRLYECIRDQLVVIGTFTDGTTADFSFRARWTSSDPSRVQVSNGEIENPLVSAGAFTTNPNFTMRPGTVIPRAPATAGPVTISAEFLGVRSALSIEVRTPTFVISPAPDTTLTPSQPTHLGVATQQRFNVIVNRDGRLDLASALNQLGPINPLLWQFTPGTNVAFSPRVTTDPADFDKYTISNGADIVANINVGTGAVTGVKADANPYPIEAQLSLCAGTPPNPIPTADIRVSNFAATNPLVIDPEAGFTSDLATDTNQLLTAIANLDPGGGAAIVTQNLTQQSRFNLEPKDAPVDCEATLTCTQNKHLFFSGGSNDLRTMAGTTGGVAQAQACFPFCVPTLASLTADNLTPPVNTQVTLTASAVNFTPGVTGSSYAFNCGAGSGATLDQTNPQSSSATCTYPTAGSFTATVRVTDSSGAISQNAGAVQIRVDGTPSANPPTAALVAFPVSGAAPLLVNLNAAGSSDVDAGDGVAVYEFDFGDDSPIVRQTTPAIAHVYLAPLAANAAPKVTVIDKSGLRSTNLASVSVTVTGNVPATRFVRSDIRSFTAVPATLTSFTISPLSASEQAFTYPGVQFDAIGEFTATPPSTFSGGATSAAQKITRFVGWAARPLADLTAFSDIAFVRNFSDDLLRIGQVEYLLNVNANTPLAITATAPLAPLATVPAPPAETLTVCPAGAAVCP